MIWTKPKTVNMAKPAWAVEPAGHVEAMLVLGDPPGAEYFRLDIPGKAAWPCTVDGCTSDDLEAELATLSAHKSNAH